MTTFSYPITFINGTIALTSDYQRTVPEVIAHILQTKTEERVLNPSFGISDTEFSNAYDLPRLLRSLETALATNLSQYPGVSFRLTGYLDDSGIIPVTCYYDINGLAGEVNIDL